MARIRTIKPEFPQSESMGRLSRDARLLFVQLWTIADDDGKTRAASRLLASLLYPYDDDAPALIDGWLAELEAEGCILRYAVDGASYLQVCKWAEHQKIDRPSASKLPCPPVAVVDNKPDSAKPREKSRTLDADLVSGPRTKDHTPLPPTGGAADGGQALGQTFTAIVSGAMSGSLGGLRLTDRSGKKLLSWVVDVVKMLDAWTARDPDESVAIWLAFVDSDAWRFKGSDSSRWPAALGDWYANGRRGNTPKRADDGAVFDERYHARLDGGRVVLRDPSLTIAALGLACNPHDPATWPPDMRAAYAARIHVADGREVFA